MKTEFNLSNLTCPSCGSPLTIPNNSTGIVYCGSCGNRCMLSGMDVNAEILKKNDINSGVPFKGSRKAVTQVIVHHVTSSKYMPADLVDELDVVKEELICVPAYLYYCSAMASYSYELGVTRERPVVESDGKDVDVTYEKYTEWTRMSEIASDSSTVVVSGNSDYLTIVDNIYSDLNPSALVDVEDLTYPLDADTVVYNVPVITAFNEYVKKKVSERLSETARNSIKDSKTKSFKMGSVNIMKDQETRIMLGVYDYTVSYKDNYYHFYFDGITENYFTDMPVPVDKASESFDQRKHKELSELKDPKKKWMTIIATCAGIGLIGLFTIVIPILAAIGVGLSIWRLNVDKKKYEDSKANLEKEIKANMAPIYKAKKEFRRNPSQIKGILHEPEQE